MRELNPIEQTIVAGGNNNTHTYGEGLGQVVGCTAAVMVCPFALIMAAFASAGADQYETRRTIEGIFIGFEKTVYMAGYGVGYGIGSCVDAALA